MSTTPLADHALLSDCRSAALVTSQGSVDWLCFPRFDSAPVFARILDDDAGHFSIAPDDLTMTARWRYLTPGLVLETTWTGPSAEIVVTDTMALGEHERGHQLGLSSPGVLLRRVRCVRGNTAVRIEYVPRPEFGLIRPRLTSAAGAVISHGGATVLRLATTVQMSMTHGGASATVRLVQGDELGFAFEQYEPWDTSPKPWTSRAISRRINATEKSWRSWSTLHQRYDGPHRDLVLHSGAVLQGLTFARSGAIVAAATTSLPEGIGSGRTWDYRFTWIRDASMTLQGLFIAACPHEAVRFFEFLARAAGTQLDRGADLQIMFGVGGERDLSERTLPHLSGWHGTGPVRVGNGAWQQRQLDVYGAILDAAYTLRNHLSEMDETTRQFLISAVNAAAARWRDDDQGIWEVRGPARPYLHSKVMCWVALDRGVAMYRLLKAQLYVDEWTAHRDEVRDAIQAEGWSEQRGAYTQYFGADALDASALIIAIVGFCAPDDPRLLATIDAVEEDLSDQRGLIYRYRGDDGFDTSEGTFLLCTFWLAHALAYSGQTQRAERVLERAAGYASSLGLLSEQVDPISGELMGNFPQAFSHLGLITAAQAIADAVETAHPL